MSSLQLATTYLFSTYRPGFQARMGIMNEYRDDFVMDENAYLGLWDATCLYGMIVKYHPIFYLEIGAGYSTSVAHQAIKNSRYMTSMSFIDPNPRIDISKYVGASGGCVRKLQWSDVDPIVWEFKKNDIIYIDGSHLLEDDEDVTIFFLGILPRLQKGVIVHLHDIFLPEPYPERWKDRGYSEQYALAMALIYGNRITPLLANGYMSGKTNYGIGKSFWFEVR